MPGARGTLALYVDGDVVGRDEIVTQPGLFCAVGDGLCVGRDDADGSAHPIGDALGAHRGA